MFLILKKFFLKLMHISFFKKYICLSDWNCEMGPNGHFLDRAKVAILFMTQTQLLSQIKTHFEENPP